VGPAGPSVVICAAVPLITDTHPEATIQGSPCFPSTTTTTTSPIAYTNYEVIACVSGFNYNMPKGATSWSVGDVVQFTAPFDGQTVIHCGTIIDTAYPNNATDAYLYGSSTYDCTDMTHCEIPA
jgi:hypothetical protein